MKCKNCGSENVRTQVITKTNLVQKRHGLIWWLLWGWYWVPVKWIFLTIPALIIKIFKPKRYKIKNTHKKVCICQNCGNIWNI